MTDKPDLSIDQLLALRTSAGRLQERFSGVFSTETIERFLYHSYDEFATRAAVVQWLPLLAERFAVQRLTALARVEGRSDDHRPIVLFLCVHNAGRSQMAAAWFNALADGAVARAVSAGTEPAERVHPEVLTVMREAGIDLAGARPRRLTDELARGAALLITMGCGEACPAVPGLRRDDWPLDDPKGKSIERVRAIRDEVRARVESLLRANGWRRAEGGGGE